MRLTLKAFSFFLVGAMALFALAMPAPVGAQEEEVGTVEISAYHCLGLEAPGPLMVGADDCIPGPASFDFYLYDDGSDDFVTIAVGEDGVASGTLPVGTYAVHESTWDTAAGDMEVMVDAPLIIQWGFPRTDVPPEETGTLNINTVMCEGVEAPLVTNIIDDDCVRVGKNLSFYLIGDGTGDFVPVTTSNADTTVVDLPVGDYEIVDEASQARLFVSVTTSVSDLNIAYPWVDDDDDGGDPPPVTDLPETGTGTGSNVGALGAVVGGAILAAGALGARIRKA